MTERLANPIPYLPRHGDHRVVEPVAPVTILLANGREIHATHFHGSNTFEPDEATVVEDADGYRYVIAPDAIMATILHESVLDG